MQGKLKSWMCVHCSGYAYYVYTDTTVYVLEENDEYYSCMISGGRGFKIAKDLLAFEE